MELWVRSQNGQHLIKTKDIQINSLVPNQIICEYHPDITQENWGYAIELGTYKDETRALEIMSQMQKFLETVALDKEVYQMPKE